ncbi:MAG TPA: HRDC domain-containing protein [Anaerolineales bacterium]
MPSQTLAQPVWVNSMQHLGQMVSDLRSQPRLAVDTESNSLHAYRERVCLIQFSTPEVDYLVDPLEFEDLSALGPLFSDPAIEKIFHAAEYDLICLRRDFAFQFENIFDTMHAARVLGYTAVGLDKLLGEKFGIQTDKRYQKADWAARPLTAEQVDYARLDTHYLIELRDVLEAELREKGRWELAQEDFRRAVLPDEPRSKAITEAWERYSSRRDLSLKDLTILSELLQCREQIAASLDRPLFKVIEDEKLIAIARSEASTREQLAEAGLSEKQIRLWGQAMLAAVRRGSAAVPVERRPSVRPSDAMVLRLDKLKNWRKKVAREVGVESDIILPKPYLHVLAEQAPRTSEDLRRLMDDSPYRYQQYGAQILKVLGA